MKKYIINGIGGTTLALSAISLMSAVAFAQTTPAPATSAPVMININPNGNVLLRGTIESIGTNSMVVKSWGGNWTVKLIPGAEVISANRALADFKIGDIAGISGFIAQDGSFTINASVVRAWGQRSDNDRDGVPDVQDNDDDNDGTLDVSERGRSNDHDNDGIDDSQDSDDDNDGISDSNDSGKSNDHDNDGISDSQDSDDDNDGVLDSRDSRPSDRDNDGQDDSVDQRDDR